MIIRIKEGRLGFLQYIVVGLLFLAGMNLINRYYYLAFIALCLFIVFSKRISITSDMVMLFVFSLSWLMFTPDSMDSVTNIIRPFLYPLACCVGYNFLHRSPMDIMEKEKVITKIIVVLSAGPLVHFLLNLYYNFGKSLYRNTIDFWTKEILSATGQAALACMALGVILGLLFSNMSKKYKIMAVILMAVIMLYNLTLGGRTLFVLLIVLSIGSFLYSYINKNSGKEKIKTMVSVVLLLILLAIAYESNFLNIKTMFETSNFYRRFFVIKSQSITEDGRLASKIYFIKNFEESIFGGLNLRKKAGYAHDIFLDTYDEAGIFAFISMIMFIIKSVKVYVSLITNKEYTLMLRQIIFTLYLAIYLEFMIEPILQGMPWMFMLFCFIHGLIMNLEGKMKNEQFKK